MASQLEMRLHQQIHHETDEFGRAALKAELGCYWARTGDFERSDSVRAELRQKFGTGRSLKVSVRLMLLEGLLMYYKDLNPGARDRILRANLLSTSFHELELTALTSAWLAHIDFNRCNFQSMAAEIEKCLSLINNDSGNAICRISLVLGDVFLHCNDREFSQFWYEKARLTATELGDQAAIGAITYNRAALNVQNLRLKAVRGALIDEQVTRLHMELKTAINYQNLARLKSLDHLLDAATVGLMVVLDEYEQAVTKATELLDQNLVPHRSGEHIILLADLARCYTALGDLHSAQEVRSEIGNIDTLALEADDAAIVFTSLADTAKRLGEDELALEHKDRALAALLSHDSSMGKLNELLDRFRSRVKFVK